jgi:uncharacterized protein (TIGR03790 family)
MRLPVVRLLAVLVLAAVGWPPAVSAASRDVLVVVNGRHPWSARVANAYVAGRGIDPTQIVTVEVESQPVVSREVYQQAIERPVAAWLRANDAFDRTLVILLAPGLPLRIAGTGGRSGTTASVDSELAGLYRRLTGATVPVAGFIPNPYFTADPLAQPRPFDRGTYDIYMVTRLDGRTEADAMALLARGAQRPQAFVIVVDGRPAAASGAEAAWLAAAGERVKAARADARLVHDTTADVVKGVEDVTGYASWGSNDERGRVPPVRFGPGAVATTFMSSDARTMAAPPAGWTPGRWDETTGFFAGSPEALAADWLAAGLTGLGSQVQEPYLDGAFRPASLLEAWARGYTLAESFYLAMPYISWQAVVFGDPLARAVEAKDELLWPAAGTSDNAAFIQRSATVLQRGQPQLTADAARLMVRANLSIGRGETVQAIELLEKVTALAPDYLPGQAVLGQQYELAGRHEPARARYRAVLERQPANVVMLNNLAYNLGVHGNAPKEALAMAERANALAPGTPGILDTVGWLRHLTGDSAGALGPLRRAAEAAPDLCEAFEHLAEVEAAAGTPAAAKAATEKAGTCRARGLQTK